MCLEIYHIVSSLYHFASFDIGFSVHFSFFFFSLKIYRCSHYSSEKLLTCMLHGLYICRKKGGLWLVHHGYRVHKIMLIKLIGFCLHQFLDFFLCTFAMLHINHVDLVEWPSFEVLHLLLGLLFKIWILVYYDNEIMCAGGTVWKRPSTLFQSFYSIFFFFRYVFYIK